MAVAPALLTEPGIQGAHLKDATFYGGDIQGAIADERTQWPDDFDAASYGVKFRKWAEEPRDTG